MNIWNIETGELVDTRGEQLGFVDAITVSQNGEAIYSGRDQRGESAICFRSSTVFAGISRKPNL